MWVSEKIFLSKKAILIFQGRCIHARKQNPMGFSELKFAPIQIVAPKINMMALKINKMAPKINKMAPIQP